MISLKSYSAVLVQHFNNPQNVGYFNEQDQNVYTGRAGCIESGDCVRIQFKIDDGIINEICFKAQGSCATIAVASWVTSKIHHHPVSEIGNLSPELILTELQLPAVKKHCVLMVLDALQKAALSLKSM